MSHFTFHILLVIFWLLWVVLHSLMAAVTFKRKLEILLGTSYRYYRISYSFFAAITLVLVLVFQFSQKSILLFKPSIWIYIVSVPLTFAGLVVMAICIRKYFMNLSGVDVFMKTKRPAVLEQRGLHRFVRHPLYAGTLLFVWALFLSYPFLSNLLACLIMTVYTLIGIRIEEKKLLLEFGETYRRYSQKIPMLIPFTGKRAEAGAQMLPNHSQ